MSPQPSIEILMIDDDEEQFKALKNYAAIRHQVLLSYARTLEEGEHLLRTNSRIMGIILDGKGLIEAGAAVAEASEAFVHQALETIKVMEIKMGRNWSKCVLTAWYAQLLPGLGKRVRVFDKKSVALQESVKQELFDYLLVQTRDSREYIIRQKYALVFSWMDIDLMPEDCQHRLYHCIEAAENNCPEMAHLNAIRSLYEAVLKQMHKKDTEGLPASLFHPDGRVNLEWTLLHLSRKDIYDKFRNIVVHRSDKSIPMPEHLIKACYFLKEATSKFSHDYEKGVSLFFYRSVLYAFFSLLEWYAYWAKSK